MLVCDIATTWDGQPIAAADHSMVKVTQATPGHLTIEINAPYHGDTAPDAPPGRLDGLWTYEVIELFLVAQDGRYLELEFGPHGHYLALILSAPRQRADDSLWLDYRAEIDDQRWHGSATLHVDEDFTKPERFNAFAIHGQNEARRYLAHYPLPGPKPDFHQPHRFPALHSAPAIR